MSECEYMVDYLDEMVGTIDYALQSETEASCAEEVAESTTYG